MFYQESYKSMWFEKNPELIENIDYFLGTLSGDVLDRITVSFVADKLNIQSELAKQILFYYEQEGILKKRYILVCPNCDNVLCICEEDELFDKIDSKPICIECENNEYELENKDIFLAFKRMKKATSSHAEVNDTLKKHGDIKADVETQYSFFNMADSLSIDEIYDVFYNIDESAEKELNNLYEKVLLEIYDTKKEKGDRLENLVEQIFNYGSCFQVSKKYRTATNQLDVTVMSPVRLIKPTVLDFLTPFFICECKNEKEKPGNTYYHKLASIIETTGEKGAKLGVLISKLPCASTCNDIAHDKYLQNKIVLINIVPEELKLVIDKKINLLKLIEVKINAVTLNTNQQLKDYGLIKQ